MLVKKENIGKVWYVPIDLPYIERASINSYRTPGISTYIPQRVDAILFHSVHSTKITINNPIKDMLDPT